MRTALVLLAIFAVAAFGDNFCSLYSDMRVVGLMSVSADPPENLLKSKSLLRLFPSFDINTECDADISVGKGPSISCGKSCITESNCVVEDSSVLDNLKSQLTGQTLYFHGALHYLDVPQVNSTFSCNATVPATGFSHLDLEISLPCNEKKNAKDLWDPLGATCIIIPRERNGWPTPPLPLSQKINIMTNKKAKLPKKDN